MKDTSIFNHGHSSYYNTWLEKRGLEHSNQNWADYLYWLDRMEG